MVNSSLHISVPRELLDLLEKFNVPELIKVQCYLAYSRDNCRVILTAHRFETISRVTVAIN
jgi:hypothetical protein